MVNKSLGITLKVSQAVNNCLQATLPGGRWPLQTQSSRCHTFINLLVCRMDCLRMSPRYILLNKWSHLQLLFGTVKQKLVGFILYSQYSQLSFKRDEICSQGPNSCMHVLGMGGGRLGYMYVHGEDKGKETIFKHPLCTEKRDINCTCIPLYIQLDLWNKIDLSTFAMSKQCSQSFSADECMSGQTGAQSSCSFILGTASQGICCAVHCEGHGNVSQNLSKELGFCP